ncbi:MAG: hypothetical protein K2K16_04075 [Ruminococcus sp.]|nr:hypothetical protein [Ruminococcus sp.]
MNDIITEIFDKFRIVFHKVSDILFEILYYITGIFDICKYIYDKSYFIIIASVVISIAFIILKSRKDDKLKKRFLFGFLIFTGIFIISTLTGNIFLSSDFNLPDNVGFFIVIVNVFSQAVFIADSMAFFSAYIFVCIHEKKKRCNNERFQDKF